MRGVPRLLPDASDVAALATAARFGAQWARFDHMSEYQERWLRGWLAPLGPEDFRDKTVLDAGCGKGRHTVVVAGWGAREVVALDLGPSVDVARAHTRALPNVTVVQGDILHPPLVKRAFDIVFSIGVLHHLPDPRAGFESLVRLVKPGGKIAIWVYGYESNEWIVRWVNPVRERITSRMPEEALYWATLPPSAALAALSRLYRADALAARLPYGDYLRQLASLPLREIHNIVYDQLVTPIAYYLPEREVRSWFEGTRFRDVTLAWHNRNSWRASATVV